MRRSWVRVGVLGLAMVLLAAGVSAFAASGGSVDPPQEQGRRHDHESRPRAVGAGERQPARLERFRLLGHSALNGFGDYGDLYAHAGYAYVGSRCGAGRQGGAGVQVVDLARPARPRVVATLPNPAFTRAEDVTVQEVRTAAFTGAVAVVGIQACFGSGHEAEVVPGLLFYDVTRPTRPRLLARWDLPQGTIGCHEIDAAQRADGAFLAVCARNLVDHERSGGQTAVQLVDATRPASPRQVAAWTLGLDADTGVGCLAHQFAHSARFTDRGTALWVSYWDAGTVHLNITNPAAPAVVSTTKILPPDEDGDNHSMTLANGGRWLIISTEDFSPGDCPDRSPFGNWGEVHIYDNSTPAQPRFLGTFATDDSRSTRADGNFTDHNTEVVGADQFFSSWYAGGIVWWTMNEQGVSHQIGRFVPPTAADGSLAEIWGVSIDRTRRLVLASDIRGGLWIIRPTGLAGF